jgi:hypothetical protein
LEIAWKIFSEFVLALAVLKENLGFHGNIKGEDIFVNEKTNIKIGLFFFAIYFNCFNV